MWPASRLIAPATATVITAVLVSGCGAEPAPSGAATAPATPSAARSPAPTIPAAPAVEVVGIDYVRGQVAGGASRIAIPLGSTATIQVSSDTADEVHLHGYDVSAPVAPGAPAMLTFDATIAGVFEVELEESGVPLGQIEVS